MNSYDRQDVLNHLDSVNSGSITSSYKGLDNEDIAYSFFLDLEEGHVVLAGSYIHVYADDTNWAVVFETNGYHNRAFDASIQLIYAGNCIKYIEQVMGDRRYISNLEIIQLISADEFQRVLNRKGSEMEQFELIAKEFDTICIRGNDIPINHNQKDYIEKGIEVRDWDNPDKLIGFDELIRYLHEVKNPIIRASETDIRRNLPDGIEKIMEIRDFHYVDILEEDFLPSKEEIFQLIADIIISKSKDSWKPTKKSNNSWKNWDSGSL